MDVIKPGHRYALKNYGPYLESLPYLLCFAQFRFEKVEREVEGLDEPVEETIFEIEETGVIAVDVIEATIHHLQERQKRYPDQNTAIAITKLQESEMWLKRKEREYEINKDYDDYD